MDYTLIRSERKTLAVEIRADGAVLVRAPKRIPQWQIDRFVAEREDWIASHVQKMQRKREEAPPLTQADIAQLKARAKAELPARVAYYAARMRLPVPEVRVGSARTRYGSCTAKNVLHFSCYLMANAPEAIDYVVVHELAHMRHKNHGAAFHDEVAGVLPDWKARKKQLFMPAVAKEE